MMGIGFWEMMVIAGIALVVIGPEKFPDFAKVVVRTIRDLRGYMDEVRKELSEELKPVEREMRSLTKIGSENLNELRATINNPASKTSSGPSVQAVSPDTATSEEPETEEKPWDVADASSGTTAYGAYSPETDEDYDHTEDEVDSVEAPETGNDGGVADAQAPERLDG